MIVNSLIGAHFRVVKYIHFLGLKNYKTQQITYKIKNLFFLTYEI